MNQFSFPKEERLKSRKLIGAIFNEGDVMKNYPVMAFYLTGEDGPAIRAGFSVGKKNFKRAVDRNKIKRWMKEAYRLNKHVIMPALEKDKVELSIMFVYTGRDLSDFHSIEEKIIGIFRRFSEDL